jgi:hypothetical protein
MLSNIRPSNRGSSAANLEANLAEGAPLLIAPSLHTSPVSILHKTASMNSADRSGGEEEYPRN